MSTKLSAMTLLTGAGIDGANDRILIYDASATLDKATIPNELATFMWNAAILVSPTLGTPLSGNLINCNGLSVAGIGDLASGVAAWLADPTSARLATAMTNETGSGLLVFSISPVFTTPNLGTPSAAVLTNATGLPEGGLSLTNIATNNVSITKHGFAPILPNDASKFLDGTGAYSVPAGGGTVTHTGALTANALVLGNGAADTKPMGSFGTTTTVLHGNAGGAPTFGAVSLATDVTDALPLLENVQTGTSYTIVAGDAGKEITQNNAAASAYTLPQATGSFAAGFQTMVLNLGLGVCTITPTTSTINGLAAIRLQPGDACLIVSDGTNYQAAIFAAIGQISLVVGDGVNAISANAVSLPFPVEFSGKIIGYSIMGDAGTCTAKWWKKATGTAIPTIADVINTSGVGLSSGTAIRSSTVSDFTTVDVVAGDILIATLTAVSGMKNATVTLRIRKC